MPESSWARDLYITNIVAIRANPNAPPGELRSAIDEAVTAHGPGVVVAGLLGVADLYGGDSKDTANRIAHLVARAADIVVQAAECRAAAVGMTVDAYLTSVCNTAAGSILHGAVNGAGD